MLSNASQRTLTRRNVSHGNTSSIETYAFEISDIFIYPEPFLCIPTYLEIETTNPAHSYMS